MQVVFGNRALSSFDHKKTLSKLKLLIPSVQDIQAEYVHFLDTRISLNIDKMNQVKQLLDYGAYGKLEQKVGRKAYSCTKVRYNFTMVIKSN
jgi:phosphoribosylformylglycinamidine synthase